MATTMDSAYVNNFSRNCFEPEESDSNPISGSDDDLGPEFDDFGNSIRTPHDLSIAHGLIEHVENAESLADDVLNLMDDGSFQCSITDLLDNSSIHSIESYEPKKSNISLENTPKAREVKRQDIPSEVGVPVNYGFVQNNVGSVQPYSHLVQRKMEGKESAVTSFLRSNRKSMTSISKLDFSSMSISMSKQLSARNLSVQNSIGLQEPRTQQNASWNIGTEQTGNNRLRQAMGRNNSARNVMTRQLSGRVLTKQLSERTVLKKQNSKHNLMKRQTSGHFTLSRENSERGIGRSQSSLKDILIEQVPVRRASPSMNHMIGIF
jgi:hypothetical protein